MRIRSVLLTLAASLCSMQAAVMVTPSVTSSGGNYTYNFNVFNGESQPLIWFQLALPSSPISVDSPSGWITSSAASGGQTMVQWLSSSSAYDILPSQSLAGFLVTGSFAPAVFAFEARDSGFTSYPGTTAPGQASVPEPSTFGIAVLGLFGLPLIRRWMTRSASA